VIVWLGDAVEAPALDEGQRTKRDRYLRSSVLRYLEAPVFRRAWVFQELLFSRKASLLLVDGESEWERFWERAAIETISSTILSGHRTLPLVSMPAFHFYTVASSVKLIASSRGLAGIQPENEYKKFGVSTSDKVLASQWAKMLDFAATLNTTDPRDRVFALSGLTDAFGIEVPKPDYSKSTRTVFRGILGILKARSSNNNRSLRQRGLALPSHYLHRGLALLIRSGNVNQHPKGNQQRHSDISSYPETTGMASVADTEQSYHSWPHSPHHKGLLLSEILLQLGANAPCGPATCPLTGGDTGTTRDDQHTLGSQFGAVNGHPSSAKDRSVAKRKRGGGPRKRGEDDEDDEESQHKKQTDDPWNRLACPYFQRDLDSPRLNMSCRGPGFDRTSRLKWEPLPHVPQPFRRSSLRTLAMLTKLRR